MNSIAPSSPIVITKSLKKPQTTTNNLNNLLVNSNSELALQSKCPV